MSTIEPGLPETDPRFPSGRWTGFFLQPQLPGKHQMELLLTFRQGLVNGEGRDRVGAFTIRGRYSLEDGKCTWTKHYIGRHDVFYSGYGEERGIWGKWDIPAEQNRGLHWHGGFFIWPEGMGDPTGEHLEEEADLPVHVEELAEFVGPAGG
jgi:hypothetical protein